MEQVKRQGKKGIFVLAMLLCFLGGIFGRTVTTAAEEEQKRILFISSYSYSWSTVPLQIQGIQEALGGEVNLEYAFMDTKAIDDETSRDLFYQTLKYRLSKVEPYDIIIVGDDAALQFAMDYKEELFDGIPIIFEAIDDLERALEAGKDPLVTGIAEQVNYEKNIEITMKINPKATKIVGILDDTITGQGLRKQFYKLQDKYPELEFEEINCSKLDRNEICDKLIHISEDTILFFLIFTEDADGNMYANSEGVSLVTKYTSVPVYRNVMVGIGDGLIGGNVVSHEKMGEMAGQMAMDILNGTQPSEIEVVTDSPTVYYFDEQVINKFGISKAIFPDDTVFINESEDTMAGIDPKVSMAISIFLAAVLIVLVSVLLAKRVHMRKMKNIARQLDPSYSHDTLTGIGSRMAFLESLQRRMLNKTQCSVILFDIDDFNKINDNLGHSSGDVLLTEVAGRLAGLEDNKFRCYRIGGDEFVAIVRSGDREEVDHYVRAIQELSREPFELDGKEYIVQFSIGIAAYPKDGNEVVELVNNAGTAMAEVKKVGKDGFCYFGEM